MYKHNDEIDGSMRAAAVAVPLILQQIGTVTSVVDVGGGTGAWLREFERHGVATLWLIDVPDVKEQLLIDTKGFRPANLAVEIPELPTVDLAICLECAEHLPPARGPELISRLTASADWVVFSAAPPGQGGKGHINLRLSSYWSELFKSHGFVRRDTLRPELLKKTDIPYWYAQNIFMYCRQNKQPVSTTKDFLPLEFHLVHEQVINELLKPSVPASFKLLKQSIIRSFRRRFSIDNKN
jgi:hypothetical protein